MAERWRPVRASRMYRVAAGVFEASSGGHARLAGGQVLDEVPDKDGYMRVKHKGRWYSVAVLVALAFKGEPQVRHLAERTDNRPAKLAWGSKWENEQDKKEEQKRSGTVPSAAGTPETPVVL